MNKSLFVVCVCLMFMTLSLSGCELLEEEDYITVVVVVDTLVLLVDINDKPVINDYAEGVNIQITMTKDGGERVVLNRQLNEVGVFNGATGTFKVYKEQPVECYVTATQNYGLYAQVEPYIETLSWDEIDAAVDFGDTYTWQVGATITMQSTV